MEQQRESNYILSRDGLKLNYIIQHVEDPIATIAMFHGHGEHAGRYSHVMDFLMDQKIASVAFDFRGHGLSDGKIGHMPSMDQMLNDVEEGLKLVRSNYLDTPMFLFGHSLGGCVVLNYVLKKPTLELTGFISSSPWLGVAFEPPAWKIELGKMMANLIPKFSQPTGLVPDHLSKDPKVSAKYIDDSLVHDKMSARFYVETTKAGESIFQHASSITTPGLVYHGNADQIISFDATKKFAKNANKQIEFHELDGVYHEPHNDIEKQKVLDLIKKWLQKQLN